MRKILSNEEEKLLIEKYLNGISSTKLSHEFKMSRGGVATLLSRKGIKRIKKEKKITKPLKLTPLLKKDILNEYISGVRISALSKKYNIREGSIRRWFKRENLKTRKDIKGDDKKKDILELHQKGLTTKEIQEKLEITYQSVIQVLWKNNLKPNKFKKIRNNIDESYFNQIDTERKAYFFGLLCADGSVMIKNGRISLCLKSSDIYLIEELKQELKSTAPIILFPYRIGNNFGGRIQMYSIKIVSDLIRHGCIPNKSRGLNFPFLANDWFGSFLRGYIDGNGSISKDGMRLSITAPPFFNEHLKTILYEKYNIYSCLSKKDTHSDLIIVRRESLSIIRNLIYKDATIFMKRKKERFMKGNYLLNIDKKIA